MVTQSTWPDHSSCPLWNARWPHDEADPESYWGYVTTMGSTEGNLYALWIMRVRGVIETTAAQDDAEVLSCRRR